ARAMPGWKRWLKPTFTRRPARSAAAAIASTWATETPAGFSTSTCAPAPSARCASSASRSWLVATTTTSGRCASRASRAPPPPAAELGDKPRGGLHGDVVGGDDAVAAERLRALAPDQAAADDADAQRRTHAYTVPEQPWYSKSNGSSGAPAAAIAWRTS